jgi:hypothetical protein
MQQWTLHEANTRYSDSLDLGEPAGDVERSDAESSAKLLHEKLLPAMERESDSLSDAKATAFNTELGCYQQLQQYFESKHAKKWDELPGHKTLLTKTVDLLDAVKTSAPANVPNLDFRFRHNNQVIPESETPAYRELFEMVWSGDIQGIKARTLTRWGADPKNAPLKVSVYDDLYQNTLVMVALQRRRFDLAKMLLQIAKAQYRPKAERVNYFVDEYHADEDSDLDSDTDESDYYIGSDNIDDTFELGDVTHIPEEARSEVAPVHLLCHPTRIAGLISPSVHKTLWSRDCKVEICTPLTLALIDDDFESFVKILDLANEFDSGTFHLSQSNNFRWRRSIAL